MPGLENTYPDGYRVKIGLSGPMTNMVKVQRNVHGKSNETNNFAFEDMVILGLESTRLDG